MLTRNRLFIAVRSMVYWLRVYVISLPFVVIVTWILFSSLMSFAYGKGLEGEPKPIEVYVVNGIGDLGWMVLDWWEGHEVQPYLGIGFVLWPLASMTLAVMLAVLPATFFWWRGRARWLRPIGSGRLAPSALHRPHGLPPEHPGAGPTAWRR